MHLRPIVTLAAGAVLLLAACSSGGTTPAPTTNASAPAPSVVERRYGQPPGSAPTTNASAPAPSVEASTSAAGSAVCAESAAPGEVSVAIKDFAFNPPNIQAKVGQTITFTNDDSAPHTATLDDGSCTTPNIAKGASDGLVFGVAGTYPFHCNVHPYMKGTITVS